MAGALQAWQERKLGESLEVIVDYRGKTPPKAPTGIPTITAANVKRGRLDFSRVSFISRETYDLWTTRGLPEPGDVLLTTEAPVGEVAAYPDKGTYLITRRVIALRGKRDSLDNSFLKYCLLWPKMRNRLVSYSGGSTVPRILKRDIKDLALWLPPLSEQRAIASILGALDDKIELNRKMNQTLEAMVQSIFKSWFVDFDPVIAKAAGQKPFGMEAGTAALFPGRFLDSELGPLPEGWEVNSIYSVATVTYGAPFKSKFFNEEGNGRPLLRIRDLATHDPGVSTPEEHPKGQVVKAGDIVVGMDGEFRVHVWRGPESWLNQRVCMFVPRKGVPTAFLRFAIEEPLAFFERAKTGTTVIHLGKRDIDTFRVVTPDEPVLRAYGRATNSLLHRITSNEGESRTLADLRDTLLPKLLSGEIRVGQAEKQAEKAL